MKKTKETKPPTEARNVEPSPESPMYMIIQSPVRGELEIEINRLLLDGWKPCGGLACPHSGGSFTSYAQAMAKGVVRE